jgi:hypothetical protein
MAAGTHSDQKIFSPSISWSLRRIQPTFWQA